MVLKLRADGAGVAIFALALSLDFFLGAEKSIPSIHAPSRCSRLVPVLIPHIFG